MIKIHFHKISQTEVKLFNNLKIFAVCGLFSMNQFHISKCCLDFTLYLIVPKEFRYWKQCFLCKSILHCEILAKCPVPCMSSSLRVPPASSNFNCFLIPLNLQTKNLHCYLSRCQKFRIWGWLFYQLLLSWISMICFPFSLVKVKTLFSLE